MFNRKIISDLEVWAAKHTRKPLILRGARQTGKTRIRYNEVRKIIDFLYSQPVTDASKIGMITNKSKATNYKLPDDLEKLEILKEITGAQRNKLYIFNDYLELFKSE